MDELQFDKQKWLHKLNTTVFRTYFDHAAFPVFGDITSFFVSRGRGSLHLWRHRSLRQHLRMTKCNHSIAVCKRAWLTPILCMPGWKGIIACGMGILQKHFIPLGKDKITNYHHQIVARNLIVLITISIASMRRRFNPVPRNWKLKILPLAVTNGPRNRSRLFLSAIPLL